MDANSTLRVSRGDGAVAILVLRLGHASSSAGRVGSSAELTLGVFVHDSDEVLEYNFKVDYWVEHTSGMPT